MEKIVGVLFLTVFLCCGEAHAQKMIFFGGDPEVKMQPLPIKDSSEIDRTSTVVFYTLERNDSVSAGKWSTIRMEIGSRYIKQTDMGLYYRSLNSIQKAGAKAGTNYKDAVSNSGSCSELFFSICNDRQEKTREVFSGDFFERHSANRYSEEIPAIKWELKGQTDSIAGFLCHLATAHIYGRRWNVWYTLEIPVQAGPWKLEGLPGLIMKASDSDNIFTFECNGIKNCDIPMFSYEFRSVRDFKTRSKYLKYERACFEHPLQTFGNGEEATIVSKDKNGNTCFMDESYSFPYIPIELE